MYSTSIGLVRYAIECDRNACYMACKETVHVFYVFVAVKYGSARIVASDRACHAVDMTIVTSVATLLNCCLVTIERQQ